MPLPGREVVVAPGVVTILDQLERLTGLRGVDLIDPDVRVGAAVLGSRVVCGVRRPLLARLEIENPVRHGQQIEHLLTECADPLWRNDVAGELRARTGIDDGQYGAVRLPRLREIAGTLERRWQVGAHRRG